MLTLWYSTCEIIKRKVPMVGYLNNFASTIDIEQRIASVSLRVIIASSILLAIMLVIASMFANKKHKHLKTPLFTAIVFVILVGTGTLFGSTIYLNVKSDSGGPVHWHADLEIWACDVQLELRNPSGLLSNKIGTSTLHEHNDQRIHLEGVVVDETVDATLGKFMRVIGGSISENSLVVPVADNVLEDFVDGDSVDLGGVSNIERFTRTDSVGKKVLEMKDGQECGNGQKGDIQAFVYQYNKANDTYSQKKVTNPENYSIRDESIVPPGDCIIVEFGKTRDKTDRLCEQYGLRDEKRCTQFGVSEFNPSLCKIREVPATMENN